MIVSQNHSIWAGYDPKEVEAMREMINVGAVALPDSGKFDCGGPNHQIRTGISPVVALPWRSIL
jgi:hypothetical protein